MDRSVVERVVIDHLPHLSRQLGLGSWELSVSYDPGLGRGDDSDNTTRGECSRLVDYQSAHIVLNPDAFDSEADVLRTLRHELYHVVLAPIDLYSSAVEQLDSNGPIGDVLGRVLTHSLERCVAALERMYDGLTRYDLPAIG